jgi:hypothetical protein
MAKSKRKNPPSIAIIGSGYWGKNLVRNFYNLGALKLVYDNFCRGTCENIEETIKDSRGRIDRASRGNH